MIRRIFLALLFLSTTLSLPLFAVKEYYSISKSLRALGMGGAYYAISDDEYALFYNPAGLGKYKGPGQFMFSLTTQLSGNGIESAEKLKSSFDASSAISNILTTIQPFQGNPIHYGVSIFPYYMRRNFAIGLLLGDVKANVAYLGREFDSDFEITAISDSGLFFGYGRQAFAPRLYFGFTAKLVARAGGRKQVSLLEIAQGGNLDITPNSLGGFGLGLDLDLGTIYELPRPRSLPWIYHSQLALTINNTLASRFPNYRTGGSPPNLPRSVTLGAAATTRGVGIIDNFIIAFDLAEIGLGGGSDPDLGKRTGSFWKHVNTGVEASIRGWFRPRVGLRQGLFTLGFGVNFKAFKMDFAWYGEELGSTVGKINSRRVGLRLAFGSGAPPPPPLAPDTRGDPIVEALEKSEKKPIEMEVQVVPPSEPSEDPKEP